MSNFKTQYNSKPSEGFTNSEPSLTIQGETQTIKEIVSQGMINDMQTTEEYLDNPDIETINQNYRNPQAMDLVEIEELSKEVTKLENDINELTPDEEKISNDDSGKQSKSNAKTKATETENSKEEPKED